MSQWIGMRVEAISTAVVLVSCAIAVASRALPTSFLGALPSILALAVSNSVSLSRNLQWMVRVTTKTEAEMSRVERMHHYCNIEPEAPLDGALVRSSASGARPRAGAGAGGVERAARDPDELLIVSESSRVPASWPARGEIRFTDVQMRCVRCRRAPT